MSFILDALKKSENDRQRQSGPALFEVRVAPPRSKLPLLAVIIVSLLVVNLGVVGWIMLRKPAAAAIPAAPPVVAAPVVTPAPAPVSAQPSPPAAPAASQALAQNPQAGMQPPPGMPPQGYNGAAPNNGYAPNGSSNGYPPPSAANNGNGYPPNTPGAYGRTPNEPRLADQGAATQESVNPDDYAPARDAPPPGSGAGHVTRGTVSGLPSYDEAASQTSIPPLHMDLHSYAADPTKRFVLINMKRLYEGQALPEGPRVESITPDSAIMSYNGTRFVMDKD
ncbi:MAG: general secretion pathway protein GspB [Gammaproteobacteria bacterium]